MTAQTVVEERTKLQALAYQALAGRFAAHEGWGHDGGYLVRCMEEAGWIDAARLANKADVLALAEGEAFRRAFLRIADRSLPPPYETTYTTRGSPADLADIAGFYRAFGVELAGEKQDHVVAELEFLALLALREAHARESGEDGPATICAEARALFLRDHAGCWLDAFASRVREEHGEGAMERMVRAAASAVAADAREHGVAPSVANAHMDVPFPGPQVDLSRPPCDDGSADEFG